MCAWYDAAGHRQVRNSYDAEGRVIHQIDANGGEYGLAYADDHTTTTDADGNVSEVWYDTRFRTTKTVDANGAVIAYEYDARDNITAITDALGNTTRYEYDAAGHKTKETAPDGSSYSLQYDNKGNLIRLTNWLGGVTRYEYDEHNRCVKQVNPDGGVQRWTYTEAGQVETVTDPLGAVTRYEYAGVDLVKTIDPLGNETSYRYDEKHRLTETTDALGNTTSFVYDDADNLTSVTFADGTSFAYEYDAVGNMIAETDAAGGEATAAYDGRGRLTETTDELGNQTAYEYDLNGNLIAQTLATGDEIRYTYDVRGRLQTMEAAGESLRYEYDAAGNVTRTVVGTAETIRRYDSMSRIVYELDENGENAQYRYDLAGNAVWISNSYGETVNEFDANGNLVKVKDAKTGAVKFRYERDALGNKTAVYLADGSMIRYDYDELGVYRGSEYVEPGRQPHGTVPGANYKPSRLVPPAEETKNWKKTDALKEADKQIRHAKFAEYTTEVAYVEAEAMAPGSAQAKRAKAAYEQTTKAVDAAYAAKDAIADAKTQREISRAVTGAQIASGTADRAVDAANRSADSAATAKKAKQAEEELKKTTMAVVAELVSIEEEAACGKTERISDAVHDILGGTIFTGIGMTAMVVLFTSNPVGWVFILGGTVVSVTTLYGTSMAVEGGNEICLLLEEDYTTQAYNPMRDEIFGGNQELYDLVGWTSAMGSIALVELLPYLDQLAGSKWNDFPDIKFSTQKIQHEYKHAADFGVEGNWNSINGAAFQDAILKHINTSPEIYLSQYRGQQVYVYFNPETGLGAYVGLDGTFIGGWELSASQILYHITNGIKIK